MATVKNYGISGVNLDVQIGRAGPRLINDAGTLKARNTVNTDYVEILASTPDGSSDPNTVVTKDYSNQGDADTLSKGIKELIFNIATGLAGSVDTGQTLPALSRVVRVLVNVTVAFDADGLTIGVLGDLDKFMIADQIDLTNVGMYIVDIFDAALVAPTNIYYNRVNPLTSGAAEVYVEYRNN